MAKFETTWQAPEFEYREKEVSWYWISIIAAALIIAFSVWEKDFLFGLFIVIAEMLFIVWGNKVPAVVPFTLTDTEITIGGYKSYLMKEFESWSADSVGNGGEILALLRSWDTNTVWSSWDPSGNGIINDGIQAAVTPTATAGVFNTTTTDKVPGGYHSYEVTPDVQNWANGTLANNGWGLVPYVNGADGWGINSSKDPNTNSHPQLAVYYTLPAGYGVKPVLLPLQITGGQVVVNFTGTAGSSYTVWRTGSLPGTWTSLGSVTVGQNGTGTCTDTSPLTTACYYRVSNP